MRIELTTEGGVAAIPGLAKPILLESMTMSSEQCAHLQRLVDAALMERTQCASPKAAVPDGRRYRLTIQRDGARSEIEAEDPAIPPAIEALMQFVRLNGRR